MLTQTCNPQREIVKTELKCYVVEVFQVFLYAYSEKLMSIGNECNLSMVNDNFCIIIIIRIILNVHVSTVNSRNVQPMYR